MSDMATFHASNMLRDCFGNEYSICRMPGSGFCGFHCLALSLTGSQFSHGTVIDDCISMFMNIPDLFRLRTNFGTRNESRVTVSEYASFMQEAIGQVHAGRSVHTDAWCEDGHLAAISLLYDIVILTYSLVNNQWYVFNESGTRGYICLLSSPGHFDVLSGVDGPPVLPVGAHTHCVTRDMFRLSDDLWQCLQQNYSFRFVFKLPEGFRRIHILNHPVKSVKETVNSGTLGSDRNNANTVCASECDFPGCTYTTLNLNSMRMHKVKCHSRRQPKCINTASMCDFPGCSYTTHSLKAMHTHKLCHRKTKSPNTTAETRCTNVINVRNNESVISRDAIDDDVEPDTVENIHAGYACSEADTDVCSIRSSDSTASRRSQRIAERPVVSYVQHVSRTRNTTTVQSDSASAVNVDSSSVRRSSRIGNRKRVCTAMNSESKVTQAKRSKVHKPMATWSSVDGNVEPSETVTEDANAVLQATVKNFRAQACVRTLHAFPEIITKQHVKHSFAEKITALENEIQPRGKTPH